MIDIKIRHTAVTSTGHAGGIKGQDTVCAAVSTLITTYAAMMQDAARRHLVEGLEIRLEPGDAEIRWIWATETRPYLMMLLRGLKLVDEACPGRIRVEHIKHRRAR